MRTRSAAAAAVAVLAAVTALVGACGSSGTGTRSPVEHQTFIVRGAVILHDSAAFTSASSTASTGQCSGTGDEAGVRGGASVVVSGTDGKQVGRSDLGQGSLSKDYHATSPTCSFEIEVGNVRQLSRSETYTLRVGGHQASFTLATANSVFVDVD